MMDAAAEVHRRAWWRAGRAAHCAGAEAIGSSNRYYSEQAEAAVRALFAGTDLALARSRDMLDAPDDARHCDTQLQDAEGKASLQYVDKTEKKP
jgi:hypothetical protein